MTAANITLGQVPALTSYPTLTVWTHLSSLGTLGVLDDRDEHHLGQVPYLDMETIEFDTRSVHELYGESSGGLSPWDRCPP